MEDKSIITTAEEIEGYEIVKALLSDVVDKDRITIRDTRTYCGILLDDTRRKAICRLYMNSETAKHIRIMNGERDERGQQQSIRYDIAQANDITNYEAELIEAVKQYLTKPEQQTTEQDPTPPYHHDG